MSVEKTRNRIEATMPRSAWSKGVKLAALDLLDDLEQCGLPISKENLLNGSSDWRKYSEGGCALIWNADIAERYCTPSELKRCKGGERMPNNRENWIELQGRALYQADKLITRYAVK